MARTPKYWYDIMIAEKNTFATLSVYQPNVDSSQTLLADLATTSKVAIWRLMFWCVACAAYALDAVFDLFKLHLESIAAKSRYGTLPWYVDVAKQFQYGDSLSLIDLEWRYPTVNEANKIVKLAAAKENELDGRVNVKVATLSGTTPVPLSAPELAAFNGYMQKKRPAGIVVTVINEVSDEIQLYLDVDYDPLVLMSNGALISDSSKFPVEDAIKEYMNGLDFDARFELMAMVDKIQQALGVKTVYVTSALARYGANPFTAFTEYYYSRAGHMVIDPATPLSSTITYNSYV